MSMVGAPSDVVPEGPVCMVVVILSESIMSGKVEGLVVSDDLVD